MKLCGDTLYVEYDFRYVLGNTGDGIAPHQHGQSD